MARTLVCYCVEGHERCFACRPGLDLDQRKALAKTLGLPPDLSPDDVKALFAMPDDDDTVHMERKR